MGSKQRFDRWLGTLPSEHPEMRGARINWLRARHQHRCARSAWFTEGWAADEVESFRRGSEDCLKQLVARRRVAINLGAKVSMMACAWCERSVMHIQETMGPRRYCLGCGCPGHAPIPKRAKVGSFNPFGRALAWKIVRRIVGNDQEKRDQ